MDHALSLDEKDRAGWLESFAAENPDLANVVRKLLQEHMVLAGEKFLETAPEIPADESSLKGQKVGPYTLLSPIGQGGMGSVWLAERSDGRFERRVAVKFLHFSVAAQGGIERFKREGRILGQLTHPNIAELLDAGVTATGEPYLVLEYVEGEPITQYCDKRALTVEDRIILFQGVLSAVAYAHASLVVHRDIKPSNVLVRSDGEVKLLDFGIAKLLANETSEAPATLMTLDGASAFTPQFAAPEQITGAAITTGTDVYALGSLLYLLLTGRNPIATSVRSAAELVKAIVDVEPPPASKALVEVQAVAKSRATTADQLRRQLRGDVDTILSKALAKNPAERYSSVAALEGDLQHYLKHEPILARPQTLAYRTGRFVRRNRAAVALVIVALLAIIAGTAGTLIQARVARQQRDFARRQLARVERINELNQFLLSDASASDKPFTVPELLERARRIVESEDYSHDPANHVEMLVAIGTQDPDPPKALPVLEKAYQLSLGLRDPSIRARAACALGAAIFDSSQEARAESLYQEGLHDLPDAPEYVLDRVICLLKGGDIATRGSGTLEESLSRVQEARQLLASSGLSSSYLNLRVLESLGQYSVESHLPQAIAAHQEALALEQQLGYENTMTASDTWAGLGLALVRAGRPAEAEPALRRSLELLGNTDYPWNLQEYAEPLRLLGRVKEAEDYAKRGYSAAVKRGNDYEGSMICSLELVRIYSDEHKFAEGEAALAEAEKMASRVLPPGYHLFAVIASDRARLSEAEGNFRAALAKADQAVDLDEAAIQSGRGGAPWLPWFLYRRAGIEVESNQPEKAVADAERALALLQSALGRDAFSMHIGLTYFHMGQALQLEHRQGEAQAAFRSAAEHLKRTLGPGHPRTLAALQLAGN